MQKFLPILTILAGFSALPVLADVPATSPTRCLSVETGPLAARYIPQRISRTGWATLTRERQPGTLRTVTASPTKISESRLPKN